jgi:hypothetical protein
MNRQDAITKFINERKEKYLKRWAKNEGHVLMVKLAFEKGVSVAERAQRECFDHVTDWVTHYKEVFPGYLNGDFKWFNHLLLTESKVLRCHHVDSYDTMVNDQRSVRFQGFFYWEWPDGRTALCENPPLILFKHCTKFMMLNNRDMQNWTFWFDPEFVDSYQ